MRRLLPAVLAAHPAAAERRQFGNVVYDLPPDWSQGRSDEGRQVLLFDGEDEVCPHCSLSIGPGEPAQGASPSGSGASRSSSWTRTTGSRWRS